MDQFLAKAATGPLVLQIEGLIRTALFRKGADIVGYLLQAAADQIDATCQPSSGESFKGREAIECHGLFGSFKLQRDYYYSPVRGGHYPADAALGLDTGHTPALLRLVSLEGADELAFQKAEKHPLETGGIRMDARQIQRLAQRVGPAAQALQQREYKPGQEDKTPVPIMYVSADGTGGADAPGGIGGTRRQAGRWNGQDPAGVSGLRIHSAWRRRKGPTRAGLGLDNLHLQHAAY
jgi:hypothetical protein